MGLNDCMMMDDITATVYMSTMSIVVCNRCTPLQPTNLQFHPTNLQCHFTQLTINIYHNISASVTSLSFVCHAINHQTIVM